MRRSLFQWTASNGGNPHRKEEIDVRADWDVEMHRTRGRLTNIYATSRRLKIGEALSSESKTLLPR